MALPHVSRAYFLCICKHICLGVELLRGRRYTLEYKVGKGYAQSAYNKESWLSIHPVKECLRSAFKDEAVSQSGFIPVFFCEIFKNYLEGRNNSNDTTNNSNRNDVKIESSVPQMCWVEIRVGCYGGHGFASLAGTCPACSCLNFPATDGM